MGDTKPQPLLQVHSASHRGGYCLFLAIKLQERLGLGARVEIPWLELSFGVTSSLSKSQPRFQGLMLWIRTKGNTCTCSSTQRQNPPSTASLPLPSLPAWITTCSQFLPALLISTAPAPGSLGALKTKRLRIVLVHFIHFSLEKAWPGMGTSGLGASVCT